MLRARSKCDSRQKQTLNSIMENVVHSVEYEIRKKEVNTNTTGAACPPLAHSTQERLASSTTRCTCLNFPACLPITVITIFYCIYLPISCCAVGGAPSSLGDACGIYIKTQDLPLHTPLHGIAKNRALCELRGNLSKQIVGLRRFMGPRNFSKVWGKHNNSYAFLKVANDKNITLRTWHKQLQVYVATADRLYERAQNYKTLQQGTWISSQEHINKADKDLQRLRHLIITTRSILCDFELIANLLAKQQLPKTTFTIDAATMHAKILLKSDRRTIEEGVNPIDINMLYQRLRRTLLQMRKPLQSHCKKSRAREKQKRRRFNRKKKRHLNKQQKESRMGEMLRNREYRIKTREQRVKTRHKQRRWGVETMSAKATEN